MRVLIVDDDALVAQSLSTILSVEDDVEVVGLGCSGPEATERYRELTPDILLMDIQMPGGDGLSAAERILAEDAGARIVFLTTFSDDEYIVRALRMGARGYLIKQDVAQVAPALRSVMAGVCVLEGEVLERSTTMGLGGRTGGRGPAEEGPGPTAKDLHQCDPGQARPAQPHPGRGHVLPLRTGRVILAQPYPSVTHRVTLDGRRGGSDGDRYGESQRQDRCRGQASVR